MMLSMDSRVMVMVLSKLKSQNEGSDSRGHRVAE